MVKGRVSVIIPGRCEIYFQATIDSALERAAGEVEIVAVIDGYEPDPPLVARDDRVKLIKLDKAIGQRAAYNLGVRSSSGEYVMKIDAHALLSPGYDENLKAHCPAKHKHFAGRKVLPNPPNPARPVLQPQKFAPPPAYAHPHSPCLQIPLWLALLSLAWGLSAQLQ